MSVAPLSFLSVKHSDDLASVVENIKQSDLSFSLDRLDLEIDQARYSGETLDALLRELRVVGLVEQKDVQRSGRRAITLKRPPHYKAVETERQKLGVWGVDSTAPRYSVCVCNYNMVDTLERAIGSVASQLDKNLYEILIIDDGSNDGSLDVLERLAQKYPHVRYISLPRDPQRRLGETRNISIRAARGEYALVHIDADDEWEPYLSDLVTLFHRMETVIGHDILLAGQQTGIGKRDFLLSYGPYENVYRYEDRNMMMKLAQKNLLYFLDYKVYRTRLSRPIKKKIMKTLRDTCSQMAYEMRQNIPKADLIAKTLLEPFVGTPYSSLKVSLLRALVVLPIYLVTRFQKPIVNPITWQELHDYHSAVRGTYSELMARWGKDTDLSFLSKEAQAIYSYNVKLSGFRSSK